MAQRIPDDEAPANVLAAYDMFLEELQGEVDAHWERAAAAAKAHNADAVARATEAAEALGGLPERALALGEPLRRLVAAPAATPSEPDAEKAPRLPSGLMTPQAAYRVPILRALAALGGRAKNRAVLDHVRAAMAERLNAYDHQPIGSDANRPRWQTTAEFCRNALREEGLLVAGSPRGIWEISDAGRAWLAAHGDG
jgi:restriction system protein